MVVEPAALGHGQRVLDLERRRGGDALAVVLDPDRVLLDGRARERDEGGGIRFVGAHEHPLGRRGRLVEEDQLDGAQALAVGREHVAPGPGGEVFEVTLCGEIGHRLLTT